MKRIFLLSLLICLFPFAVFSQTGWEGTQASDITTDVTNFDNNLSETDTDLQTALETLDESAGGSGDNVSIDGSEVTNPDFVSTGDVDFVDTDNTITANLNSTSVDPAHLANSDFGCWNFNKSG